MLSCRPISGLILENLSLKPTCSSPLCFLLAMKRRYVGGMYGKVHMAF